MIVGDRWLILDSVDSTQTEAGARLSEDDCPDIVLARDQRMGRGRLGRKWMSQPGQSLTMSVILRAYPNLKEPWLIGMLTALVVAETVDCNIQWPNDLVVEGQKLGGVLTELHRAPGGGLIPIIGIGLNLNQKFFPEEVAPLATSLALVKGGNYEVDCLAQTIIRAMIAAPEPFAWPDIQEAWARRDETKGKVYRAPDGSIVVATAIGPQGQLIGTVDGEPRTVYAAEALFGQG